MKLIRNSFALLSLAFLFVAGCQGRSVDSRSDKEKAIDAIRERGGDVRLANNCPGAPVVSVSFRSLGPNVTDEDLERCLNGLTEIRSLDLLNTHVTDKGLACLRNFSQLEDLCLSGLQITDAGLAHLESLTQLRELHLNNAKATDIGLVHLKGLTQLEFLVLHGAL